jgi:DNA polymerase-3 subunit chi
MAQVGGEIWFYHLERSALEPVLADLLDRTLKRGWRAVVRSPDPQRLEQLDDHLWTYKDDSFLPHGRADEPMAERQPILLSATEDSPNGAQALFLLDGAEIGSLAGYERRLYLFDGRDEAQLALARSRWRDAKGSGAPVSYWKQTERGWEKQG